MTCSHSAIAQRHSYTRYSPEPRISHGHVCRALRDRFIDLTIRRGVYGVLAGGAAAVLLASASQRLSHARNVEHGIDVVNCCDIWRSAILDLFCRLSGGPSTRAAAVAFGAGIGVGSAYTDSQRAVSLHAAAKEDLHPRLSQHSLGI